jgi:hypothetical protein
MRFLKHRIDTFLPAIMRRATGGALATGGATFPRRGRSNTPGGVAGLITRHTRETVGSKSPQVGLSAGPGVRVI